MTLRGEEGRIGKEEERQYNEVKVEVLIHVPVHELGGPSSAKLRDFLAH